MSISDGRPRPPASADGGFSLVELMVSIFVVIITVPLFVGLQLNSVKLTNRAAELDQAIWGAQAKMEEIWLEDYDDVKNGSDEVDLAEDHTLARSWTVQHNKPVVGTKTVTVTVSDSWVESAEPAELQFVVGDRPKSVSSHGGGGGGGSTTDTTDTACEPTITKSGKTKYPKGCSCRTVTTKSGKTKTKGKCSGKTKTSSKAK